MFKNNGNGKIDLNLSDCHIFIMVPNGVKGIQVDIASGNIINEITPT